MADGLVLLHVGLAAFGVIGAALSFMIFRKLQSDAGTAMVTFQLQPGQTMRDFHMMLGLQVTALTGLGVYFSGALIGRELVLNIARLVLLAVAVLFLVIFYRWWRRFR
jgi:hypothetical protein